MKKIFLTLVLLGCCLGASSQKPLSLDPENIDNVYLFSLKQYSRNLDSLDTKTIYVRKSNLIGESWPKEILGFHIEYLRTRKQYRDAIRRNGGRLAIVHIDIFEFEGIKFDVSVTPLSASYRNRKVHYSKGGDSTIVHFVPENHTREYLLFSYRELRDLEPPLRVEPWW